MGNAFLLIVVGMLLFYIVISDKFKCVEGFLGCVLGNSGAAATPTTSIAPTVQAPTLPALPTLPTGLNPINVNWL